MPVNNPSKYPLRITASRKRFSRAMLQGVALGGILLVTGAYLVPQVILSETKASQTEALSNDSNNTTDGFGRPIDLAVFPVGVNPATKSITDNPQADAFFDSQQTSLTASVGNAFDIVSWISSLIDNATFYQSLAAVDGHLIVIEPGYRKEQVVGELASALHWNTTQQQEFLGDVASSSPAGLTDGIFAPGNYVIDDNMTPSNVAALMTFQFDRTVVSHYASSTADRVPLAEALTVASLLEREAAGPTDMRIISGIIWNRLFNNMNLQIDATLQYAMGENRAGNWWQAVLPKDKYVASAYNTYAHPGLPPGPIAEPSIAAVVAALNPVETKCLYYFHDSHGGFHCSDTYAEHVALLDKYYGQGK